MSLHLDGRRRLLAAKGRTMTLRRPNPASGAAPADLPVLAYLWPYAPDKVAGAIRQGDAQVQMMDDEIAAEAWPGPPRTGDWLVVDGATWLVQGANPVYDGAVLIGHNLWIRGGSP